MKKGVECTFGILKVRWRVLKYGIKLWGIDKTDTVWLTCFTLHNWLLEIDGLAIGWKNGVKSHWKTDLYASSNVPFALSRLAKPRTMRDYNISGIGRGINFYYTSVSTDEDSGEKLDKINLNELVEKDGLIPVGKKISHASEEN